MVKFKARPYKQKYILEKLIEGTQDKYAPVLTEDKFFKLFSLTSLRDYLSTEDVSYEEALKIVENAKQNSRTNIKIEL